jgi:hypothetical protein
MNPCQNNLRPFVGWTRIALGAALVIAPSRAARAWLGPDGASPGVRLLFRSIGARDFALGAGLLAARRDDTTWAQAGVVADTCDVAASIAALGPIPAARLLPGTVLAAAFVVAGVVPDRRASALTPYRSPVTRCAGRWR